MVLIRYGVLTTISYIQNQKEKKTAKKKKIHRKRKNEENIFIFYSKAGFPYQDGNVYITSYM